MKLRNALVDLASLALIAMVLVMSGCGGGSQSKTLYIFNWTYYTPESVIQKFEKEYGVKVVYDTFASNEEMFAKLKAGGSNYDITFPSGDYVSIMIKEGMLEKIDRSKLKNFGNIDPAVLALCDFDPGNQYSIPYYLGAAGVAVNRTKVKEYERSWSIFGRKDLENKMIMLDDMREVMGDALKFLGYSVNTTDQAQIDAARDLINNVWKPNLLKFDAEAFAKSFAAGEVWVAQGYAESIFAEVDKSRWNEVDFFIPKEGGPSYLDSMVILKNSKNKDLALKFIDFIHKPEIYAEFCDYFGFPATANVPARALKKGEAWYQPQDLAACELKKDVGSDLEKYNAAWQAIRVGK
ncbi:MAG: extracellular solute-binding protein [Rectinema sp.]|nr:extracellular solute-binding protein [Rectinema sp.]